MLEYLYRNWLRLFLSQTFFCINTPTFSNLVVLHTYLPMKMEQTECSETSAHKIQTPGNYPKESIQEVKMLCFKMFITLLHKVCNLLMFFCVML
jgi:hypothetical protein